MTCQTASLRNAECYVFSLLCLLYGLSLGPSSLLRHHIPHAQAILITADLLDSGYDSLRLVPTTDTISIRTMTPSYYDSCLTRWFSKYWY
jgi:hypothetical protein